MTDVLRKFSHNGYQSIFQANPSANLPMFQISPTESMEEILSKVCFVKNEVSLSNCLPSFDLSANTKLFISGDTKKVYFCQRCLNHNYKVPRKNHKSDCPFATCKCEFCILVERRRKLNTKLHDLDTVKVSDELTEGTEEELFNQGNGAPTRNGKGCLRGLSVPKECVPDGEHRLPLKAETEGAWHWNPDDHCCRKRGYDPAQLLSPERVPNCQKCGQHGKKSRLKGHKRVCPFKDCICDKCQVVTERQKLMADQIKIRRRQKKDNLLNMTRDHIATQIQAAAALSAASGLSQFPFNAINSALLYQLKAVPNSLLTPPASTDGSSYSPQSSLGSAFSAPTTTPEIMKSPSASLLPPSPQSPIQSGIMAPVAINPTTPSTGSAFSFPLSLGNESLLSLLANYKLLEQKLESDSVDVTNSIIDVCH